MLPVCRVVTVKRTDAPTPASPALQAAPTHFNPARIRLRSRNWFLADGKRCKQLGLLDSCRWGRGRGGPVFQQADLFAAGKFAVLHM